MKKSLMIEVNLLQENKKTNQILTISIALCAWWFVVYFVTDVGHKVHDGYTKNTKKVRAFSYFKTLFPRQFHISKAPFSFLNTGNGML